MRTGHAHCFSPINNEQNTLTDILVRNFYCAQFINQQRYKSNKLTDVINLVDKYITMFLVYHGSSVIFFLH